MAPPRYGQYHEYPAFRIVNQVKQGLGSGNWDSRPGCQSDIALFPIRQSVFCSALLDRVTQGIHTIVSDERQCPSMVTPLRTHVVSLGLFWSRIAPVSAQVCQYWGLAYFRIHGSRISIPSVSARQS